MRNDLNRTGTANRAVPRLRAESGMIRKLQILLFAALAAFLSLPAMAQVGNSQGQNGSQGKISQDLSSLAPATSVNVIVQFDHTPTADDQQELISRGAQVTAPIGSFYGTLTSTTAGTLSSLSLMPGVTYITLDREVRAFMAYSAPTINAPLAWQSGWDGTGVGVAIIDSGIYDHPNLRARGSWQSRVVYREDFTGLGSSDLYGHGTHVAGIVASKVPNDDGWESPHADTGIAPNAQLIDLRVLDQNGITKDSIVIQAIERAIELKARYNIRVINLSLGRPVYEAAKNDPLCQAVEKAWKAGIFVVVAAGNYGRFAATEGYGTITAPGNDPYVITVGAMKTESTPTRADDLIASYSSKGPSALDHVVKPDMVAPGNLVVSLLAPGSQLSRLYPGNVVGSNYFCLSGTSMAAPMVSGAAALLLQKDPALTPDQLKARLMRTATKNFPASSVATDPATGQSYVSFYDIFTVGAGYLDVWAALSDSTVANGTSLSPIAIDNPTTGAVRLSFDPSGRFGVTGRFGAMGPCGAPPTRRRAKNRPTLSQPLRA